MNLTRVLVIWAIAVVPLAGADLFLPSVGSGPGVAPAVWDTTVWVHNPGSRAANVTFYLLDGYATVNLPEWFEALNRHFRYQLTVIGQFAQAIVEREVEDNRFVIRTDRGNVKVSWQVIGIRQDAWANAHRIPVEEDKPEEERGTYLAPELWDQPEEKGLVWRQEKGIRRDRERGNP